MEKVTEKFAIYHAFCVIDDEALQRNHDKAVQRGYDVCERSPERAGRLAVVGSGPSLQDTWPELRNYDEVWAINGAYHYLLDKGIVPTGFIGVDPVPGLAEYVQRANPKTTFYLSVLCDDSVFDTLDKLGCPVKLWYPNHCSMKYGKGKWLISGGTTVMTCAPFLAKVLGLSDLTFFGADSSFDERGRYAYADDTYIEDSKRTINEIWCGDEGPFYTETQLMRQVATLGCYPMLPDIKIDFRCGGLMEAYLRAPMCNLPVDAEIINADPPPRPDFSPAQARGTQRFDLRHQSGARQGEAPS